jgi:DNA-binding transcriptional ArsR family regulator
MNFEGQVRPLPEDPNDALLNALQHPLRRSLLRRYVQAKELLSPKELASLTKQPLSSVSYHVRQLVKAGAVEIVAEEQVRGSVQHFYEATQLVKETPWVLATLGLN